MVIRHVFSRSPRCWLRVIPNDSSPLITSFESINHPLHDRMPCVKYIFHIRAVVQDLINLPLPVANLLRGGVITNYTWTN